MQARAGALDELLASGALEDATLPGGRDDIESQLDALTAGRRTGPDEGTAAGIGSLAAIESTETEADSQPAPPKTS